MEEDAFREKSFLVFGANGEIGRQICLDLVLRGSAVWAFVRDSEAIREFESWMGQQLSGVPTYPFTMLSKTLECSVTFSDDVTRSVVQLLMERSALNFPDQFAGLIYAVGNCPTGCLDEAIKTPFDDVHGEDVSAEYNLHVAGLHNVFRYFLNELARDAKVVVLGAHIAFTKPQEWPEFLNIESYYLAKLGQRSWCECMKRSYPEMTFIYAPLPPVDTSFHQGCLHKPSNLMPIAEASALVLEALK